MKRSRNIAIALFASVLAAGVFVFMVNGKVANGGGSLRLSIPLVAIALLGFILVGGLMIGIATMKSNDGHMGLDAGKGRVWSEEHQHWH